MIVLPGHPQNPYLSALAYSPDGRSLTTAACDQVVRVWDLATGAERLTTERRLETPAPLCGVVWSLDGSAILTREWRGSTPVIQVWDAQSGAATRSVARKRGRGPDLLGLLGQPTNDHHESRWLGLAEATGWHLTLAGAERVSGPRLDRRSIRTEKFFPLEAGTRTIRLLRGERDDSLLLPRTAHGTWLGAHVPGLAYSRCCSEERFAVAPDGRTLALAGCFCQIHLYDIATGQWIRALDGQHRDQNPSGYASSIHSVAFSPDGRLLVSGGSDGTVCLWPLAHDHPPMLFDWEIGPISAVAFAPDGTTVAAGGKQRIVVWDVNEDHWA